MLLDRVEAHWLGAFAQVLELCRPAPGEVVCLLAETQSRPINLELAELACLQAGLRPFRISISWMVVAWSITRLNLVKCSAKPAPRTCSAAYLLCFEFLAL